MKPQPTLRNHIFSFLLIFIIISTLPLAAIGQKYPYKEYKNRTEGIIGESTTLISGEKIELQSCIIENRDSAHVQGGSKFNFAFYLPNPAYLDLELKKISKSYLMKPKKTSYQAGIHTFSWPSTIARYYHIDLLDLQAKGECYYSTTSTIVPILLFYSFPRLNQLNYIFQFNAEGNIRELQYRIYRYASQRPILNKSIKEISGDFGITWNGKGEKNVTAPDGWYYLNVRAIFSPPPGVGTMPVINANYKFYHFTEMIGSLKASILNKKRRK